MPVRKVSNRGGNIIGYFPSIKMGKMVTFESTIERDLLYLLDYEAHVVAFEDQPLVITYLDNGLKRSYTPDYHVKFVDGHQAIIECKPEDLVRKEENQRKFAAGRTWTDEQGWAFAVITEEDLRTGCRLKNVKYLTHYARHQIPETVKLQVRHLLEQAASPQSVQDLATIIKPDNIGLAMAAVFQMVFFHDLLMEMDNMLVTPDAPVFLPAAIGGIS